MHPKTPFVAAFLVSLVVFGPWTLKTWTGFEPRRTSHSFWLPEGASQSPVVSKEYRLPNKLTAKAKNREDFERAREGQQASTVIVESEACGCSGGTSFAANHAATTLSGVTWTYREALPLTPPVEYPCLGWSDFKLGEAGSYSVLWETSRVSQAFVTVLKLGVIGIATLILGVAAAVIIRRSSERKVPEREGED